MADAALVEKIAARLHTEVAAADGAAPGGDALAAWHEMAAAACELVERHIGAVSVPARIVELASLEVARELHTRSRAPGGIFAPGGFDGTPVRLARDPLRAAYPLLTPYLPGGFA